MWCRAATISRWEAGRVSPRLAARINPLVYARFAHENAVQQVRFSPDGLHVVSSAADNSLKVWSADRLQQLHSYETQSDSTQALSISSDSQQIAVGRMDGSLDFYALKSDGDDRSQLANAAFRRSSYPPPTGPRPA